MIMYGRSCIVLVYTKVHLTVSLRQRKVQEIAMGFHKEKQERKEHEECTLIYLF
jgi:hypothetical protein